MLLESQMLESSKRDAVMKNAERKLKEKGLDLESFTITHHLENNAIAVGIGVDLGMLETMTDYRDTRTKAGLPISSDPIACYQVYIYHDKEDGLVQHGSRYGEKVANDIADSLTDIYLNHYKKSIDKE